MKKLLLSGISLFIYLSGNTQIISHPQSFDTYDWGEKDSSNVILSIKNFYESYIVNYDLSNGDYTYLNDSTTLNLKDFVMIGDTGAALTNTGVVHYTHNNWKNIAQSTVTFESIIKTNTGFLGKKLVGSMGADYYHSVDGNTWTLGVGTRRGPIAYKDGKTWIVPQPFDFQISYDGGLTFTNKHNSLASQSNFSDFIPFDSLTGLGIVGNQLWYYTIDGGNNWDTLINATYTADYIYAKNLDTIYADISFAGLSMTIDTGKTWQPVAIPLPNNTASRMYPIGNYLVSQTTATYSSQGIGLPWSQLHKRMGGGSDVSFHNNKGIIVTGNGNYYYSNDKGKTYYNGVYNFGNDLRAAEFVNDSIVLVADKHSSVWVSKDAGTTWNKNYANSSNFEANKFRISSDLSTMVLFKSGQSLLSTDQGLNWSFLGSIGGTFDGTVTPSGKILLFLGADILEQNKINGNTSIVKTITDPNIQGVILEMADDNIGYAMAINTTDSTTVVYRTTDGWVNYTKGAIINSILSITRHPLVPSIILPMKVALNIVGSDTLYINRFNVIDSQNSSSVIYKSFNGGASWVTDSIVPYKIGSSNDKLQNIHYFAAETFISTWGGRIVQNTTGNILVTDVPSNEKMLIEQTVTVFPNPTIDIINLQSEIDMQEVYLIDISGKLMVSEQVKNKTHQLNMSDLPAGIYFLRIKTDKSIETKKVVKQN